MTTSPTLADLERMERQILAARERQIQARALKNERLEKAVTRSMDVLLERLQRTYYSKGTLDDLIG